MSSLTPVLAVFAGFGARAVWTGADRRWGSLMLVMAAMLVGDLLLWTV